MQASHRPAGNPSNGALPLRGRHGAGGEGTEEENLRVQAIRGANGDEDSEAESYRDGRTGEVDRETRTRAFAWCRDFLSGSWKNISEADFQISIVR